MGIYIANIKLNFASYNSRIFSAAQYPTEQSIKLNFLMAAIYNLEFNRIDHEVSIYINGRLRTSNFAHEDLKLNARFQFYVEKSKPTELTIVFYYGQKKTQTPQKPWDQSRISFTLHKSGSRRPVAVVHDFWEQASSSETSVKEYSYLLHGDP